jgi:hypothetical protein
MTRRSVHHWISQPACAPVATTKQVRDQLAALMNDPHAPPRCQTDKATTLTLRFSILR